MYKDLTLETTGKNEKRMCRNNVYDQNTYTLFILRCYTFCYNHYVPLIHYIKPVRKKVVSHLKFRVFPPSYIKIPSHLWLSMKMLLILKVAHIDDASI